MLKMKGVGMGLGGGWVIDVWVGWMDAGADRSNSTIINKQINDVSIPKTEQNG